MRLDTITPDTNSYTISTAVYEGPLDLLLQLIERAELDITKLALAQVTDQYLEHIHNLNATKTEEVSAFLVIAARLIQIKSEALLPRPPVRAIDEEDPGEALAEQLKLYKQFKGFAQWLNQRELDGCHTYLRLAPPPRVEKKPDLSDFNFQDLIDAALVVFELAERPPLRSVVAPPRITIREKIRSISRYLHSNGRGSFGQLLPENPIRLDIVVTFLAMLELIKRRLIRVHQQQLFGEIEIESRGEWDENEEFELEFGE